MYIYTTTSFCDHNKTTGFFSAGYLVIFFSNNIYKTNKGSTVYCNIAMEKIPYTEQLQG